MTPHTRQRIADLAVFLFAAVLLVPGLDRGLEPARRALEPGPLELLLLGPLALFVRIQELPFDFVTLCALPTLWWSTWALVLRLAARRADGMLPGLAPLMLLPHAGFALASGGLSAYLLSPLALALTWLPCCFLLALVWLGRRHPATTSHGFLLICGLFLLEHLLLPTTWTLWLMTRVR